MKILLLALTFSAAASLVAAPEKRSPTSVAPNCKTGLMPGKYSEKSIYRVPSEWTDADGGKVRLDSLRGRPIVLAMFFTRCQHSCPFIVNDLKAMQKALSAKASDRVQFVLVSIDPERDSAAALKEFRTRHKLASERWTLLTGSHDAVRQLAEKIGSTMRRGRRRSSPTHCSSPFSTAMAMSPTSRPASAWIAAMRPRSSRSSPQQRVRAESA